MPKNSGKRRVVNVPSSSDKPDLKDRLRLRKSSQEQELDERRSRLLVDILNVSTQLSIDESTSPTSARQAAQDHAALLDLIGELRQVESTLDPQLPHRDEHAWCRFFEWVDQQSGVDSATTTNTTSSDAKVPPSSCIDVRVLRDTPIEPLTWGMPTTGEEEYSLITKVPVKTGERVFAVDRKLMLTTETASRDVDLDDFIKNDMIASGMQNVVLVLHLLNEHSKGERSFWWPYLSILPRKLLPILRLDKSKLGEHLLVSAHMSEALKMIRAIARQYSYFHKRLQDTKLPLKHNFTFLYYAWGVSIVCSRQNEIPQRGRAREQRSPVIHALIPLLDMCNHSLDSNQAIFTNDSSSLTAPRNLAPGDEITLNYGSRSSGDFYIHNGFVPNEVPGDMVPLTIALATDALFESKRKLLKLLNMPAIMGRFKLARNTQANCNRRDPHLTMFLIVYCLSQQEVELLESSANLVAVADYVYDYIQYKMAKGEPSAEEKAHEARQNGWDEDMLARIDKMKIRLASCYKEYLARRCGICVALIDRSLQQLEKDGAGEQDAKQCAPAERDDTLYAIRLLQREREIYASYMEPAQH